MGSTSMNYCLKKGLYIMFTISKIDAVRNETLLNKADGDAFNRLADYYGFTRPQFISEEAWRKAILAGLYGARGTLGCAFEFLLGAFSEWIEYATYDCTAMSLNILNMGDLDVACTHIGRLVKIKDLTTGLSKVYYTVDETNFGYLVINPIGTAYWEAADLVTGRAYQISFLPFLLQEYGCEFRFIADRDLVSTPASYFRNNAESRQNEPFGSHVLDLFSNQDEERFGDPLGDGAMPLYFDSIGELDATLFFNALALLLVCGVQENFTTLKWCDAASIWGSLALKKAYGTTGTSAPALIYPSRD